MPELPEVETIKEAVKKTLDSATILSASVYNRNLRIPIIDDFEKKVFNAKILRIYRIAKYMIMELNNGYSIVWHFGMSGKIKLVLDMPNTPEKHDHVVIKTNKSFMVYNDPRRFGLISLIQSDQIWQNPLFCHLGLDPFDSKLTPSYLTEKFTNKKTSIKAALLDQSIISGIGNIYASEALYKARISPLRGCSSLTSIELNNLIQALRSVLQSAIESGGSTLHDYCKPDGNIGYFQLKHCVYGKEGQHCPDCTCSNGKILKIIQNNRSTYYCSELQK